MENSQLTISDLASLHSMIEAACNRGAFRANEMSQVGQVFDKLTAFLSAASAQKAAEENPQGEANA